MTGRTGPGSRRPDRTEVHAGHDSLDLLAGPAAELLARVDESLARTGAPTGHRIWPLLRRVRILPGDAFAAVLALHPARLVATGTELRQLSRRYGTVSAELAAGGGGWRGAAAESFRGHQVALTAYLSGGPDIGPDSRPDSGPDCGSDSLAGRLERTAAYADALADWMAGTRTVLAGTCAELLGSAEAVAVTAGAESATPVPAELAAAELGARVLAVVAAAGERAEDLVRAWMPELSRITYREPAGAGPLDWSRIVG